MTRTIGVGAAALVLALTVFADTGEISVKCLPPSVIKTSPTAGATDVSPDLKEITVTFSKEMTDQSWSACHVRQQNFPEIAGKIHYQSDKKTCVLPVKLEPGKTYAIWFNMGAKYGNFKDTDGNPSVPYLLVFETKK